MFNNPAPVGGYATGDQITETQINYWCSALPDCVDGAGGGTYTLSAPLIFNGSNVTFGADVTVGNDLQVGGTVSTVDVLASGDIDIADDLFVAGTVFTNVLSATGAATLGTTLTVTGPTALLSTLAVTGTASFNGNVNLGNGAADAITLYGKLDPLTGLGRILTGAQLLPSSNSSIDVSVQQHLVATAGVTTYNYTLTGVSASNGEWYSVYNGSSATQNFFGIDTISVTAGSYVKRVCIGSTFHTVAT